MLDQLDNLEANTELNVNLQSVAMKSTAAGSLPVTVEIQERNAIEWVGENINYSWIMAKIRIKPKLEQENRT